MCSYGCVLMIYYLPRTLPVPLGPLRRRSVRSQDCAFAIRWRRDNDRRVFMLPSILCRNGFGRTGEFDSCAQPPSQSLIRRTPRGFCMCCQQRSDNIKMPPCRSNLCRVWPDPSTACMTRMTSYRLSTLSSIEVAAATRPTAAAACNKARSAAVMNGSHPC